MNKTLYCDISSHGFGHVAQSVPILNCLQQLRPDIRIVIQCGAEPDWLAASFDFDFEHLHLSTDFGMLMHDALSVDVPGSHQRYLDLHRHWNDAVEKAARRLAKARASVLYSNISYLANAAANRLSLPAINLCSLNWYGVYQHYCQSMPGADKVLGEMLDAYNSAQCFLAPTPSMPMSELERRFEIGTVARIGQSRASEIRQQYGLNENSRLVLVSHGGVGLEIDYSQWPVQEDVFYIVSTRVAGHPGFIDSETIDMSHIDLMCSCDAIISKAGYGTYAEAACHAIPLLYTKRSNWPEEIYLNNWLHETSHCLELSLDELRKGQVRAKLDALLQLPRKQAISPGGVEQAVQAILALF